MNDWSSGSLNVQYGGCLVVTVTGDFRAIACVVDIFTGENDNDGDDEACCILDAGTPR